VADADTGHQSLGLAEGATHPGLQTIGACAGQHLVDAHHVVGVDTHSEMEAILAARLHHVLVRADAGCLQGLKDILCWLVGVVIGGISG